MDWMVFWCFHCYAPEPLLAWLEQLSREHARLG
jgi:hypothetical protein